MNSPSEIRHTVNSRQPFAALPLPDPDKVHRIANDAEAITVARTLAQRLREEASLRDAAGYLPVTEVDAYSNSGLWGITVPRTFNGAEVSYATLAKVIGIIAEADPSIAQITQNHLALLAHVRLDATAEQQRELFDLVLQGYRFGNAFSERKGPNVASFSTRIQRQGDQFVVDGEKFYTTGALFAHIVPIVAADDSGKLHIAFADRAAPGLSVINDWDALGQRTTASGTTRLTNVRVPAHRVIPVTAFDRPTAAGAISQLIQAAIDGGIARAALADTTAFVRDHSRPWIDSGQESASADTLTISAIGDAYVRLHAAEALLERAGQAIDLALTEPGEDNVNHATLATAEAKILTTEIALSTTSKLFELAGTRSVLSGLNLDRHWRNARTHTLHDPVRWKYFHIGNYHLNGVHAPRHPWS